MKLDSYIYLLELMEVLTALIYNLGQLQTEIYKMVLNGLCGTVGF